MFSQRILIATILFALGAIAYGEPDAAQPPAGTDSQPAPAVASEKSTTTSQSNRSPIERRTAGPWEPVDKPTGDETSATKTPCKMQLILVRTDWSHGKNPTGIETELQTLFAGKGASDKSTADLLKSAPATLFPPDSMAIYGGADFATFLGWLQDHELVRVISDGKTVLTGYSVEAGTDLVPAPPATVERYPGYSLRWSWLVYPSILPEDANTLSALEAHVTRSLLGQGANAAGEALIAPLISWTQRFEIPPESVGVLDALTLAESDEVPELQGLRETVRDTGWRPLLVVFHPSQTAKEARTAQPLMPASLATLATWEPIHHQNGVQNTTAAGAGVAGEAKPPAEVFEYADAAPLNITLIKVRSDWSQGKDPEGTKKALESLLENETLRDEVRENLLGSASQILFPEGYLAVYKPQEFAASLAWMKERDLMQTVAESEPIANHERPDWARRYNNGCSARVFATEDMIPMTTLGTDDVPPFTKRTYGVEWFFLSWKVFEKDHTSTKEIAFRLTQAQQRVDRLQGDSGEVVSMDYYGGGGFDGTCPPDQVSVFHGFSNSPAIRQYTREKGWEPLLVIVPAGQKQLEVKTPKLARLISLQRIGKGNVLPPRTEPVEKEKEEEPKPDQSQIKVFRLVNSEAQQTVLILAQMLERVIPDSVLGADPRTNSLIVRGPEDQLRLVESLLMKLDEAPSRPPTSSSTEATRPEHLADARTDFASAEAEIQSIVNSIAGEADKKRREQLRARLTGLVAEAFDLRQKLQRAEVGLLREKIGIVETRLAQRDTLRKEIIDRRVEELLGSGQAAESQRPTPAKAVPARSPEDAAEKVSSVNKPPFPAIPLSLSAVEKIRSQTRQERFAAWARGYEGQEARNPWPAELSKSFLAAVRAVGGSDLPPNCLIEYQNYIRKYAPELDTIVNRRRPKKPKHASREAGQDDTATEPADTPEMEGIVEWNETDYARIQSTFYWVTRPLTREVRVAQENLWCYEAILNSIANVNKGVTEVSYSDAPVRRIEALKIGKAAIQTVSKTTPKVAQTSAGSPDDLLAGRYVDTSGKPLPPGKVLTPEFNILPVQLDLHLKEEALQELEQQLSKCDMPVTIARTYIGTSEIGGKTAAGPGGRNKYVFVTFQGFIPIYNPPDVSKLTDALVAVDFQNTPWPDVYQWLAETFQLEILPGEPLPEGTFTLSSSPLPRNQVLDLIDRALQAQGFHLKTDYPGPGKAVVGMMQGESVRRTAVKTRDAITKWKKVLQDEATSGDEGVRTVAQERLKRAQSDLEELRPVILRDLAKAAEDHQRNDSNATAGQRKLESLQTLQAKGYVDPAELEHFKRSLKLSQDSAVWARETLERLRKAAEAAGLTPAEIEEAETAPPAPPEQLAIIPTFTFQFDQKPWKDVLQWFADTRGYRLRIMDPIPEDQTFTYHSPGRVTLDEAFDVLRAALSDLGYRFYETGSFSGKTSLCLQATEAEALRRKVAETQSQVARWQEALADNTTPRSDEEIATLQNRLKAAQAEVALYSKGLLDQMKRSGQSLSSAERQAAPARQKWEELKRLQATGDATEAEVAAAQEAFERADKSYQFQKAQVDQFRKAAAAVGLSVPEAQGAEGSTTPPQEAPGKPAPAPPESGSPGDEVSDTAPRAAVAVTVPLAVADTTTFRTPEQFQQLLHNAREKATWLQGKVDELTSHPEEYGERHDSVLKGEKDDLAAAQQHLALVEAEYAAQIRLLEGGVKAAEVKLNSLIRRLAASNIPNAERGKLEEERELAQLALSRARTLLDLYRKVGERVGVNPPLSKRPDEAPPATPPVPTSVIAPAGNGVRLPLRTPEQFFQADDAARGGIANLRKEIKIEKARLSQRGKDERRQYESFIKRMEQDLATTEQHLELIQAEYAAQVQLLESELAAAESKLRAAAETLALMESRFKSGQTHRTEVTKAQLEYDQAKSQCDQAKILLGLYKKVESSVNRDVDAGQPAAEQDPTPGESAVKTRNGPDWFRAIFQETWHDFGKVAAGAKLEYRFLLRNVYLEEVNISKITGSHPAISARATKTALKSHDTAEIVVVVDLHQFKDGQIESPSVRVEIDKPYKAELGLELAWHTDPQAGP